MHECCNILFNYINRLTLMTEQGAKKHKLKDETRSFQPRWENGYFVTHNNGKLQCFVCMQVLSVPKEFNLNRYYTSLHADKLKKYQDRTRTALLEDYEENCKRQRGKDRHTKFNCFL